MDQLGEDRQAHRITLAAEAALMRRRQNGITFIGWLFLLVPVAIVVYGVIRLMPLYLNYMKVAKAVNQTATEYQGEQVSQQAVRSALQRRWDIEGITFPVVADIAMTRDGQTWVLEANYEDQVKLFGGISLLVHFDKRATLE
jgi:hypothetical protein